MRRPRTRTLLATTCLWCALQAPAFAGGPPDLAAMPAERALAVATLADLRIVARQVPPGEPLTARLRCMLTKQPEDLMPMFRREYEAVLTADEITVMESVYGGPLRDKIMRIGVARMYAEHGLPPPGGAIDFTPAENALFMRFVATSAGDKLFRKGGLHGPAVERISRESFAQFEADCEAKAGEH